MMIASSSSSSSNNECFVSVQELHDFAIWQGAIETMEIEAGEAKTIKNEDDEVEDAPWWKMDADQLNFLIGDYRPGLFWFEVVEFGKKFLLAGALCLAENGSLTQSCFGLFIAFGFFAVSVKACSFTIAVSANRQRANVLRSERFFSFL